MASTRRKKGWASRINPPPISTGPLPHSYEPPLTIESLQDLLSVLLSILVDTRFNEGGRTCDDSFEASIFAHTLLTLGLSNQVKPGLGCHPSKASTLTLGLCNQARASGQLGLKGSN